jgi:hypothetical protein
LLSKLIAGSTPKKIDFSTRKKAQTPKKRGLFTPMKISGEVKPKLEPQSPTTDQPAPIMDPKRAAKAKIAVVQPKIEPALEEAGGDGITGLNSQDIYRTKTSAEQDVKPDIRNLESLLGGLNLEQ